MNIFDYQNLQQSVLPHFKMPTSGFFIYRDTTAGEPVDPCAALQFYPAKDSDELFFALKIAYPIVKTHSERMRNAVIDFLIKERDEEQVKNQMPFPNDVSTFESTTASPWSSFPSISSSSSLSSPDLIDLATPASFASPAIPLIPTMPSIPSMPSMPSMNRQLSQASNSNAASTPAIDQMTSVFSLSDHSQPKARVRRKMTESEKAEYRKRRIVKACDKCSKRKRKCDHNKTEMETLVSRQKVIKRKCPSSSSSTSVSRNTEEMSAPPSAMMSEMFSFNDDPLFGLPASDDHSGLFDLVDFDVAPQQSHDWPWSQSQDWTLLDNTYQSAHYPMSSTDARDLQESISTGGNPIISDGISVAPYSALKRHETSYSDGSSSSKEGGSAVNAPVFHSRRYETQHTSVDSEPQVVTTSRLSPQELLLNDRPSSALCWAEADGRTASETVNSGHGSRHPFFNASIGSESSGDKVFTLNPQLIRRTRPSKARHTAIEVEHAQSACAEASKPPLGVQQTKTNSNGAGPRKLRLNDSDGLRALVSETNPGLEHGARGSGRNAGLIGVYSFGLPTSRISSAADLSGRSGSVNGKENKERLLNQMLTLCLGLSGLQQGTPDSTVTTSLWSSKAVRRSNRGLTGEETFKEDGHPPSSAASVLLEPAISLASAAVHTSGRNLTMATPQLARQVRGRPSRDMAVTPRPSPSLILSEPRPQESPTLASPLVVWGGSARASVHVSATAAMTSPAHKPKQLSGANSRVSTTSGPLLRSAMVAQPAGEVSLSISPRSTAAPSHADPQTTARRQIPALSVGESKKQLHNRAVVIAGCQNPGVELTMAALLNDQIVGLIGAIGGALLQSMMDNSAAPIRRKRVDARAVDTMWGSKGVGVMCC